MLRTIDVLRAVPYPLAQLEAAGEAEDGRSRLVSGSDAIFERLEVPAPPEPGAGRVVSGSTMMGLCASVPSGAPATNVDRLPSVLGSALGTARAKEIAL